MSINLNDQSFQIHKIDILSISSCSNFQVGDNETVVLTSFMEDIAEGHQYGPFPLHISPSKFKTSILKENEYE